MSVFQLQEWWHVQTAQSEEFDFGCMVIGNLDNARPATDKIGVGSQQGMLRIYNPTRPQYRMEDLVLEESLGEPILQLLLGQFIPLDENLGLAVLHPRKLAVYEITGHANRDGRNVHYHSMRKCYEHDLGIEGKHFTAYNMISGPFGGVRGRDMIMVQSLDGKLQIFEQSANSFTRQLVDCLLPCPLVYLPKIDAFTVATYACQAECYRYQVLASSQTDIGTRDIKGGGGSDSSGWSNGGAKDGYKGGVGAVNTTTGAFGLTALRSALVEWSINLGEGCRQLVDGNFSGTENRGGEVLAVCDQSLFLLRSSGGVIQQKKLESDPSCICAYKVSSDAKSNFLLASHDGTIGVYSDFNLVWAAKVASVPVQIAVGSFGGQRGLVATIDDTGRLAIGYLGTRPPSSAVVTHARELDYDKIDEEHRALLGVIRESQSEDKAEPKEKLLLRTQMMRTLDRNVVPEDLPPSMDPNSPLGQELAALSSTGISGDMKVVRMSVRVYVSFAGGALASETDVTLMISTPSFIHATPNNVLLKGLSSKNRTPTMVTVYLYAKKSMLPTGFDAQIMASYVTSNGEARVSTHVIALPLHLACRPKAAVKTGLHKITLDTAVAAIPLTDLFNDFLYAYQDAGIDVAEVLGNSSAQAMGFQFWCTQHFTPAYGAEGGGGGDRGNLPAIVSILVSKTAGRYRIQSDCLPALYTVAAELERRLREHMHSQSKGEGADDPENPYGSIPVVTTADPVPIDEYVRVIQLHFTSRVRLRETLSQLNDCAHQFRMIEKRLLVRFKDRNPTPLSGLDVLMRETYQKLLGLGDAAQELQGRIRRISNDLHCATRLVCLHASLISPANGAQTMSAAERKQLEAHFCVSLTESVEQGWEESVDLSLTYLLKTALAKNQKDSVALTSTAIELPSDIDQLRKHINLVIDRLSKGARLAVPNGQRSRKNTAEGSAMDTKDASDGVRK